jgi:hypothetical protein
MNDIVVKDTPLTSLVKAQKLKEINPRGWANLRIPLSLNEITSYFVTQMPKQHELEDAKAYTQIVMTYDSPKWDPGDIEFEQSEERLCQQLGYADDHRVGKGYRHVSMVWYQTVYLDQVMIREL